MWPFSGKKEKPFINKITLYSQDPQNWGLGDSLNTLSGRREDFATDFLADPSRPGVSIRHQAEYDRSKQIWDLVAVMRIGEETGLEPGLRRETLAKTSSFFDTLHWCSTLQAAMEKESGQSAIAMPKEGDWQDFRHWRVIAEETGQAYDMNGVVHPCANGKPLTDGHFTDAQLAIAKKTKPPEPPVFIKPEQPPYNNPDPFTQNFSIHRKSSSLRNLSEIFADATGNLTRMETRETRIINRPINPGETFEHDGTIIFKTFVPDNVKATSKNGGIVLEQGGGDGLVLKAEKSITVKQPLGSEVCLETNGSVNIKDIKGSSHISVKGSLSAKKIGEKATINVSGSMNVEHLWDIATCNINGSVKAHFIGSRTTMNVGGSIDAELIGERASLSADGSIKAGHVEKSVTLSAGGKIHIQVAAPGVSTSAGSSVKIDSRMPPPPHRLY